MPLVHSSVILIFFTVGKWSMASEGTPHDIHAKFRKACTAEDGEIQTQAQTAWSLHMPVLATFLPDLILHMNLKKGTSLVH